MEIASCNDAIRQVKVDPAVQGHVFAMRGAIASDKEIRQSGQQDISERDEEILCAEIDSVHGWDSNLSAQT